jgi:hypothetical protein
MNVLGIVLACIVFLVAVQPEKAGEWWAEFNHSANDRCTEAKP